MHQKQCSSRINAFNVLMSKRGVQQNLNVPHSAMVIHWILINYQQYGEKMMLWAKKSHSQHNPMHVFLEVCPTVLNGAYSEVSKHRIGLES